MYTQEDVRKLFMQRGEIEMELKVRQAQYYGKEAEIPSEMAARVMELQRELMTIDGFFAALSENEALVQGTSCRILAYHFCTFCKHTEVLFMYLVFLSN